MYDNLMQYYFSIGKSKIFIEFQNFRFSKTQASIISSNFVLNFSKTVRWCVLYFTTIRTIFVSLFYAKNISGAIETRVFVGVARVENSPLFRRRFLGNLHRLCEEITRDLEDR